MNLISSELWKLYILPTDSLIKFEMFLFESIKIISTTALGSRSFCSMGYHEGKVFWKSLYWTLKPGILLKFMGGYENAFEEINSGRYSG